jgi:hypothetical protein
MRTITNRQFVCLLCGDVLDVECLIGATGCLDARLPDSYRVDESGVPARAAT